MNLPNKLTFTRLFLAYLGFGSMLADAWIMAFFLILISVLLDAVDGSLARRLGQVSTAGVFLDVMADKVVIISTFLLIGYKLDAVFFFLGLLMILREYAMDTMRSIAAAQQKIIAADVFSKLKGVMFMTAMLFSIGNRAFFENIQLEIVGEFLAIVGMLLAYLTLIHFFRKFKYLLMP